MKSKKLSLQLDILGLSIKEKKVLALLMGGENTPLLIHKKSNISRSAIYYILGVLKKRGLIERYKEDGKFYYRLASETDISERVYAVKKELLGLADGRRELLSNEFGAAPLPLGEGVGGRGLSGVSNVEGVIIHKGLDAVKACFTKMFTENKNCRFIGVQGNNTLPLYGKHLGQGFVDELNKKIKENKIISEGIISEGWEATSKVSFDAEWATHYTGRMANVHQIPDEYFRHHGEIFLFGNTLYLISLRNLTIIEVRHGDISIAVSMLIKYIMDHTHNIDINRRVKELYGI